MCFETGRPDAAARAAREETAMSRKSEFDTIALPHVDFLYNMALKITRNQEDARDLLQDTILRAYRFFERFQEGTNCKAWLYRIMKNTFINHYRKQRRRPSEVQFDAIEGLQEGRAESLGTEAMDPEETLLNTALSEDVRAAFDTLPAEYREVLVLGIVEGFSYREIAAMVGCPIGTVMSRLHRARKIMQRQLLQHAAGRSWSSSVVGLARGA